MYGRCDTENSFGEIRGLGAQSCELYLRTFYEYRPDYAKKFSPRTEGLNMYCVRVMSYNFEPQLFSETLRQRGDGFYWLEQLMRSAQIFGAEKYALRGLGRSVIESGGQDFYERLNEVAEFCSRYGVGLCVENSYGGLCGNPEIFAELKNRCAALSGVLDLKQAKLSGYPYAMYIAAMQGSISHVRLFDIDENGKFCLPGFGISDFNQIFLRLKGAGFDGNAFISARASGGAAELKKSLDFLGEILYKIK